MRPWRWAIKPLDDDERRIVQAELRFVPVTFAVVLAVAAIGIDATGSRESRSRTQHAFANHFDALVIECRWFERHALAFGWFEWPGRLDARPLL